MDDGEETRPLDRDREYRAVFEAAPDGIVVVDAAGRITDANPAAERMFGYDEGELVGRGVETLVPEASRSAHRAERESFAANPRTRPMGEGLDLEGRRRDGSTFPVEISLSPVEVGGERRVISIVRDVSDRERLRRFGTGTVRATEEERRRIARELHDDTAQRLASLLIRLRLAREADDASRRDELLEQVRDEVLAAVESIRRVARGLRPPALEDAGLGAALRSHVRQRLDGATLDASLEIEAVEDGLDDDRKLVIYRIVQEALSNVVRHADASRVRIRMHGGEGRIVAEVEDDGRGFEVSRLEKRVDGCLGVLGMEERATLVGGELEIESRPGRGTTVRVCVPTAEAREEEDG